MMIRTLSIASSALALFVATPAFAGTLTVGPPASGATFNQISAAISAAQPGDVILVEAGFYQEPSTLFINKPLSIIGAGAATTNFEVAGLSPFEGLLPMSVSGLQAGEEVRVMGLTLSALFLGGAGAGTLAVADCEGPVVFTDVAAGGNAIAAGAKGLVRVTDSDQVLFDNCSFAAVNLGNGSGEPTPAVKISDSNVYLNACDVLGASAASPLVAGFAFDGAPAIHATNSVLRLSRTSAMGGSGTAPSIFFTPTVLTVGGAGVSATTSQVFARGGPGNLLEGGRGGRALVGGQLLNGAGGSAAFLSGDSLLTTVSDSALVAGADFGGAVSSPLVGGAGAWAPLPTALGTIAASNNLVTPGSSATFEFSGAPIANVLPFYSFGQGQAFSVAGAYGEILLDLGSYRTLPTQILDTAGLASLSIPVPPVAALIGASVLAQSLTLGGGAVASFSAPTFVAIR